MNRVEQILKEVDNQNIFSASYKEYAVKMMEHTALQFSKWKDENYRKVLKKYVCKDNVTHYDLSMMDVESNFGKTVEELFNEWNNLNQTT